MQAHQQISAVIDHIVEEGSNLDPATIEDYKKLVARLGRIFHNSKEELKLAGQSADLRK